MQATQESLQNQIIQGIPNALLCSQITCIPYRAHPLAGVKFTLVMERNTWQWLMHGRDPQRGWCTRQCCTSEHRQTCSFHHHVFQYTAMNLNAKDLWSYWQLQWQLYTFLQA